MMIKVTMRFNHFYNYASSNVFTYLVKQLRHHIPRKFRIISLVTMEPNKTDDVDRIAETFTGKTILVTGGTGFVGKVLIEKLLRSTLIKQIYMIVRPKKGKDPKQRLKEMFNSPLFDLVKNQKRLALEKMVTIVNGDMELLGLGLSPEDRKVLCENINIVYHSAATIRFDVSLKKAVLLNTRGTQQMIELAKEMKNLFLFVYISTAYSHPEERVLDEKTYPPPADPHKIIKLIEWLDDDVLEIITKKILGKFPNTYAFTKALAEGLVEESMPHIPSIILRPSIILPIWKEPLVGWTDNINGPTGMFIGVGKGIIRSMHVNANIYADYIPVDMCIQVILVVTWSFVNVKKQDKRVVNLTSSNEVKVNSMEIMQIGLSIVERVPLNGVVWYPYVSLNKSQLIHNIYDFFFHIIPAYVIDAIIFLAGYKPVMCSIQRRVKKGFEVFDFYNNRQWDFDNSYIIEVRKQLNNTESNNYRLYPTDVNVYQYFENSIRASKIYILNEPPETLPAARRHMRIMYWVDVLTKILFFLFVMYMLASWSENFRALFTRSAM